MIKIIKEEVMMKSTDTVSTQSEKKPYFKKREIALWNAGKQTCHRVRLV